MGRRWVWFVAAVAALAAVGFVVLGRGDVQIDVETVAPVRQAVFRSVVTASGEITATRFADIGSSAMGKIVSLPVKEGDRVRVGQVLARIDGVQARGDAAGASAQVSALEADERAAGAQVLAAGSELRATEARAVEAAAQARRLEELLKQGLVAAADYERARAAADTTAAQVASARAAIDRAAQTQLAASRRIAQAQAQRARADDVVDKTSIVSPIDGVVSRLRVREGEMVVIGIQNQPGTTLMTISDLSSIDAEVKVAEADVLRLTLGQRATVVLEALPGRRFEGTVAEIGASALPITGAAASAREFKVIVRLDRTDALLRPGLTCDAEIVTDERKNVLVVPLQSVVLRAGTDGADRPGVFAVRDARAVFVPVTTGVIGGLSMEVSGVKETDAVIAGPYQVLRDLTDGAQVRVVTGRN